MKRPADTPRSRAARDYWERWRREQRKAETHEPYASLESDGQLRLDLAPVQATDAQREVFD